MKRHLGLRDSRAVRTFGGGLLLALLALTVIDHPRAQQQPPPPQTPPAQQTPPPQQTPPDQQPQPQPEMPRFRAGANLVRLDAYISKDGAAVTDLRAEDFEVFEDGVAQKIESFEVVKPRPPAPEALRVEPNSVRDARAMAEDPNARLFVLFLDIWHVTLGGSHNAKTPIVTFLNEVIGRDDLVGVMTPEMSARNLTLGRRTTAIEGIMRDQWFWGERDRLTTPDPREREIEMCYPDFQETSGIAREMILRRRERKTLDAIQDLIVHLEGIREERKFVLMLSSGWLTPTRNSALSRVIKDYIPGIAPIGAGPDGKLTTIDPRRQMDRESCERERNRLAQEDLASDFRYLLQRANRANVSFYTMDPRGLVVFDNDIGPRPPPPPTVDAAMLNSRQATLRELAENTDGIALLNTNDLTGALRRMMRDLDSYYLLGYYSTNTKLDGRFRKLSVRVKRPGVDIRSRPGYLAPTEAEMATARVDRLMNGAPAGHSDTPPELRRALERLTPSRGNVPVRMHATAGPGQIWVVTELDAATIKQPEWLEGGRARVLMEHERGAVAPIETEVTLAPGQRSFSVMRPEKELLPPGRYVVRLSMYPKGSSLPVQSTGDVNVPDKDALISTTGLASRRGPSTGLQYVPTADARFRRTERVRFEIPRVIADGTVIARLLSRDGQALPLTIALSERVEDAQQVKLIVADLTLAPLAQGEYLIEVTVEKDGMKATTAYAFRIVP